MTDVKTILVGTIGQGIMRSADGGESWRRVGIDAGMHSDALVRALGNHPDRPGVVFAGTDKGLYRSEDGGQQWKLLDTAMSGTCVWAMAIDSTDPNLMFAGTGTPDQAGVFRSADGGKTWEQRPVEIAAECPNVGVPRVTGIAIDPNNHRDVWVGLEVDGLRHSADAGDTWELINGTRIPNMDVHNVAVAAGPPHTVVCVVNNDVYTSGDNGGSWDRLGIREVFPLTYPRGIMVKPDDPNVIFVTIGDTTPGQTGTIMRSKDTGKTWEDLPLPVEPNTAMWTVNIQSADPSVVLAGSRYGYLYRSDDGGDSWDKLRREFSEISSVMWLPE